MNTTSPLRTLLLAVSLVCGCAEDPLGKIVYARIDQESVTAADVRDAVSIRLKLDELKGKTIPAANLDRRRNGMAAKIIPQLVSARMMKIYLDRENLRRTEDSDRQVLAKYNRSLKTDCKSVDELAGKFGDLESAFRRHFADESRVCALDIKRGLYAITDEDKARYYSSTSNQIRQAAMFTKRARENADLAWRRLEDGEPWDAVAKEVTEDRLIDEERQDFWKEWDAVPETAYPYPEVIRALEGIGENRYTRPFESEMGMLIVKVNKIDADGTRICSRILFRMGKEIDFVPENRLEDFLRRRKVADGHRELLDEIGETVKFEYPQGESFKVTIWPLAASKGK